MASTPLNPSNSGTGGYRRHRQSPQVSRRLLLGGAAAAGAAGLVAAGHGTALGATVAEGGTPTHHLPRPDRFGRVFPDLPSFAPANDSVRAALREIGKQGGMLDARDFTEEADNPDADGVAGITFFGQFLDHDMTFDTTSELGFPTPPEETPNARTPALDLDSVYGGGPAANPALYQSDRTKLRIESGGMFEDLPREPDDTAIIADPRNDENVMIGGIHSAVILAHNRVVDHLRAQGHTRHVFARARRIVTWHHQWIILHEFLPAIVGAERVHKILRNGRRFYRPEPGPAFIPVEFQTGTYRFGHSIVRPAYRANRDFAARVFDPTQEGVPDPQDLRGGHRAPRRFIDWQFFFDFGDGSAQVRKRIDLKLSSPLFDLPLFTIPAGEPPTALAQRNLLRHLTWEIPSGQKIAQHKMGELPIVFLQLRDFNLAGSTPLWFYILGEADIHHQGAQLGPVGGTIVGEVMIGLLQLDPRSFLSVDPGFRPFLPRKRHDDFTIVDLLRFARVSPEFR